MIGWAARLAGGPLGWLAGVPLWVYAIAVLGGLWLYERHEVKVYRDRYTLLEAQGASARIQALERTRAEDQRRIAAAKGVIDDQDKRLAAVAAAASAADGAVGRLRARLAALGRTAGACSAPAAADRAPADPPARVLTELLGQCVADSRARAEFADRAHAAGVACERSYDALTPPD